MIACYSVPTEGTSPKFARAFAKGCGDAVVTTSDQLLDGDVALFGSPQRWDMLQRAIAQGRRWFYGDHAYFGRREYYRVTRNAMQHDAAGSAEPQRFERFGIRVKKWRGGRHVLLCPNSPAHFERHGTSADEWIAQTVLELRRHTTREIRVRWKADGGDLEGSMRGAHAVVVFTSVSGVLAALSGVPCFATAPCASLAFGTSDLSRIEDPVRPDDRFERACVLAANQWTLHEIALGMAWKELNT